MKVLGATLGCSLLAAISAVCVVCAIFVLVAFAIAEEVRAVPIFGPMFSDAILAWLGGVPQPVATEPVWDVNGVPISGGEVFTGTVPVRQECWIPGGLPVSGPLTQAFRPASNPSHTGIDISVNEGTPVLATMCGTVVYSGFYAEQNPDGSYRPSYGYLVILENGPYRTYYAHNRQLFAQLGGQIERGQTIAASGSTGWSTGPHVHYEVRARGTPIDPLAGVP